MGYRLPSLVGLREKLQSADAVLGSHLYRYVPPPYKALREACMCLSETYSATVESANQNAPGMLSWLSINKPDPTRIKQCELIALLATHLEEDSPENRAVLFGAIFHRLLRIKDQQDGSYIGRSAKNTTLYPILCRILQVNIAPNIDALSLSECLMRFKEYVIQESVSKEIDYIQFDPDFFEKLEDMIIEKNSIAMQERRMLQHITFVQSISNTVLACHDTALAFLDRAFSQLDSGALTKNNLIERLSQLSPKLAVEPALAHSSHRYLSRCWFETRVVDSENRSAQRQELQQLLDSQTRYILIGLLNFAYQSSVGEEDKVTLKSLMNWNFENPLDVKGDHEDYLAINSGMEFLYDCLINVVAPEIVNAIDFKAFDNKERFQQVLLRTMSELNATEPKLSPQLT